MEYEQFLMNLRQESVGVIFLLQAIHIEMPAASGCDSAKGCFKSWCRVVHWARMKYVVKCLLQKLLPGYHIRALRANLRGGVPPWRSVDERTGPPKHLTLGVVVESCITGDRSLSTGVQSLAFDTVLKYRRLHQYASCPSTQAWLQCLDEVARYNFGWRDFIVLHPCPHEYGSSSAALLQGHTQRGANGQWKTAQMVKLDTLKALLCCRACRIIAPAALGTTYALLYLL